MNGTELQNATILANVDGDGSLLIVSLPNAATQRTDVAYLAIDPEHPNWYSVQWIGEAIYNDPAGVQPYIPGYRDCWAWVEDDVIYLPSDGQTDHYQRDENTHLPDRDAGWYDPQTGIHAVFGIPNTTMVRML